jgi:predicted ester cyclase
MVTWKGTHTGEFAGVPGTGREMSIAGWDLVRVQDGRIVELTQYCDVFTLLNQIGAMATAAPA